MLRYIYLLDDTIVYYVVLYCTALYCIGLYCIVLHILLYCVSYLILSYMSLYYTIYDDIVYHIYIYIYCIAFGTWALRDVLQRQLNGTAFILRAGRSVETEEIPVGE